MDTQSIIIIILVLFVPIGLLFLLMNKVQNPIPKDDSATENLPERSKGETGKMQNTNQTQNSNLANTAITILYYFAWINLVAGVVGGLIIMFTMGTVEQYYSTEINPVGIVIGALIIIEGVVGFAIFILFSELSDKLLTYLNEKKREITS